MTSIPYDRLPPDKQQVIDAAIYRTEAFRIIEGEEFDDDRDCFFSDQRLMVDYLRGLYAVDIQTNPSLYFQWRSDGPAIIRSALDIQEIYSPAVIAQDPEASALMEMLIGDDGIPWLSGLLEHLTNMPYPQERGDGVPPRR